MEIGIGNQIKKLYLAPGQAEYKDYNLKLVAIYSRNSKEYVLFDVACACFGFTSVPIYDTLGEEATEFMFRQTNLHACFVTVNHIKGLSRQIIDGIIDMVFGFYSGYTIFGIFCDYY